MALVVCAVVGAAIPKWRTIAYAINRLVDGVSSVQLCIGGSWTSLPVSQVARSSMADDIAISLTQEERGESLALHVVDFSYLTSSAKLLPFITFFFVAECH